MIAENRSEDYKEGLAFCSLGPAHPQAWIAAAEVEAITDETGGQTMRHQVQKAWADRVAEQSDSLAALAAIKSPNSLFVTEPSGRIVFINARCRDLLGLTKTNQPLPNMDSFRVELGSVPASDMHGQPEGPSHQVLARYSRDGAALFMAFETWTTITDDAGQAFCLCIMRPVADSASEASAEGFGVVDPMTGLPNQFLFRVMLDAVIKAARRDQKPLTILLLDLDRFKSVNDDYGHQAGDVVLRLAADRIRQCVRESDILSRIGGDEFAVTLIDSSGPGEITHVADRILAALNDPMEIGQDRTVSVGCSIGAAIWPDDGTGTDDILHHADLALYAAKRVGGGRLRLFSGAMRAEADARVRKEHLIRRAVAEDLIEVHYQPVCSAGRVVSVEALVRLRDADGTLLAPTEFLDVAEDIGLGAALGQRVLERACRQIAAWRRAFDPALTLSVNVSRRQIEAPGFDHAVLGTLRVFDLPNDALLIEVHERILMAESIAVEQALRRLATAGVRVAIDEFGAGVSSLSRLGDLPLSCLKLSRTFITELMAAGRNPAMIGLIARLAEHLNLTLVAEGVETAAQASMLEGMTCATQQGFHHGRPGDGDAITHILSERRMAEDHCAQDRPKALPGWNAP